MRIAILSTFYPYRGGIAQFNASIYRKLEIDHEVKAFTFKRQYPSLLFPGKTQMVENDKNADPIPSHRVLDSINPISYYSTAKSIKEFNPDLLITRYWMSFLAPSTGFVAGKLFNETKIIAILDNVIPHEKRFFDTALTKYFLNRNHGFIAMSDAVMHDLYKLKPDAKCLRMDHPLYTHFGTPIEREDACNKLKINANKKNLLFFGFIRDYKGLDLLIEAFNKLDNSYNLIIAGESYGSFEKYRAMINRSPLKDNIFTFNDYIPDNQVPTFFSAADVCILPYKSATQSGITSIAYHFEVPIIATDVGGLKEAIEHGSTGLVVPKAESQSIAEAIKLYFNNVMKLKMKHDIIQLKEKLSWEKFAEGIVNFSNSIS